MPQRLQNVTHLLPPRAPILLRRSGQLVSWLARLINKHCGLVQTGREQRFSAEAARALELAPIKQINSQKLEWFVDFVSCSPLIQ